MPIKDYTEDMKKREREKYGTNQEVYGPPKPSEVPVYGPPAPSSSTSSTSSNAIDYTDDIEKRVIAKKIDFNSLQSDIETAATAIGDAYGGWQTQETMANTKALAQNVYDRLGQYQAYQKKYGGADISEIYTAFGEALGDWDKLSSTYGRFKSAESYGAASKVLSMDNKYSGLTFDQVQGEKSKYDPNSFEYKYFDNYTGYNDLREFDKAIEARNNPVRTASNSKNGTRLEDFNLLDTVRQTSFLDSVNQGYVGGDLFKPTSEIPMYYENQILKGRDLSAERNKFAIEHKADLYKDVMANEDYAQTSAYVPLEGGSNLWKKNITGRDKSTYRDLVYEYVNGNIRNKNAEPGASAAYDSILYKNYELLNDEERGIFNYLYNQDRKNGTNSSIEFLEDMQITLDSRKYRGQTEQWKEWSKSPTGAALNSIASIPANIAGAIPTGIDAVLDIVKGNPYNPYSSGKMLTNYAMDTRQYVGQTIAESTEDWDLLGQNIPQFLYQTGMSIGDNLLGAGVFGGAYTALMGTSAFQTKAKEMVEAGEDNATIYGSALASAAAEILFEKISLDSFLKIKGVDSKKALVKTVLKQAGVEASEEFFTEVSNILTDNWIRGEGSDIKKKYNALLARGFSETEASKEIAKDVIGQVSWAAIGGALSGAVMGSAGSIKNYAQNSLTGRTIQGNARVEDLVDMVSSKPELSEANQLLRGYTDKGVNSENISNAQVGNLFNTARGDISRTISSKDSTTEQRQGAMANSLELASAMTSNDKRKEVRETYKIGSETKSNKTNEGISVKQFALKDGDVTAKTSKGDIKESDITFALKDAEVLQYAKDIANDYGETIGNLFIQEYDGKSNVEAFANRFNLALAYAKNNYSIDTILEKKGELSTDAVKAIYAEARTKVDQEHQVKIEALNREMAEKGEYKGFIDDREITDAVWKKLDTRQRQAVTFIKGFAQATGMNLILKYNPNSKTGGTFNAIKNTITIDVSAYATKDVAKVLKETIIPTMSHEVTHWMRKKSPKLWQELNNLVFETLQLNDGINEEDRIAVEIERIKRRRNDGKEVSEYEAREEIIARACEDMLSMSKEGRKYFDSLSETEKKTFVDKIKEIIEGLKDWVSKLLGQYKSDSYEAKALRNYQDRLNEISEIWDKMLVESVKANQSLEKSGEFGHTATEVSSEVGTESKFPSDVVLNLDRKTENVLITKKDIVAIQNIPTKSISQFTSQEIADTENFARKYFEEMGVKSPFFRAWFGDWRAYDITSVNVVTQKSSNRGTFKNDDTTWKIQISGKVFTETKKHKSTKIKNSLPYLDYIEGIVKNAVLLDTYTISKEKAKSKNSAMMHSLYAVVNDGKSQEVLKLLVEELNDVNSDGTILRSYQLQEIKKIPPASVRVQKNLSSITNTAGTIKSISDLFRVVKTFDKDFYYSEPSVIRNADGTPKVLYHQTENVFTIFDTRHAGAGTRDNETPFGIFMKSSPSNIGLKGNIQMPLYANIRKPLEVADRSQLVYKLKQISPEFEKMHEQHKELDKLYQSKFDNAMKEFRNYLIEWRNKNPDASRQAVYEDETFNKLHDAEDMVLEEWETEAKKLEAKTKEVITNALIQNGYDGVILKYDEGSFGKKTDTYIALESTQVKSVTDNIGTFDKSNRDILYSDREDTSVYDLMGEADRLRKENAKIKADIEALQEALAFEKNLTGGNYFNEKQLGSVANVLKKRFDSTYDKVELMKGLRDVYRFISTSEQLTWEDVYARCYALADKVLDEVRPKVNINEYYKEILRNLRGTRISFSETQKAEAKNQFGSHWNRSFMGSVIVSGDGIPLDSIWQEWADLYPGIGFDRDISDADMPSKLYDVISSLRDGAEIIEEYNKTEDVRALALEIYNQYWNVSFVKTEAEKYDHRVMKLKLKHKEAMAELREEYKRRMDEQIKEHKIFEQIMLDKAKKDIEAQKKADDMYYGRIVLEKDKMNKRDIEAQKQLDKTRYGNLIRKILIEKTQAVDKARNLGWERYEKYKSNAERRTVLQSTIGAAMTLNRKLITNSKDVHIPDSLKPVVINLLNTIDFSSKKLSEKGEATKSDIERDKALSKVRSMVTEPVNIVVLRKAIDDAKQKLFDKSKNVLSGVAMEEDESLAALNTDLIEDIEKMIEYLDKLAIDGVVNLKLQDMNLENLRTLNKMVRSINHWAVVSDKALANKHKKRVSDLAMQTVKESKVLGERQEYHDAIEATKSFFTWSQLLPIYAFKRLGSAATEIFYSMMDAQDKVTFNRQAVIDFTDELLKKHKDAKKWRNEIKEFDLKLPNGDERHIKLPVTYLMSLYCVAKRQASKNHLYGLDPDGKKMSYTDKEGVHDGGGITIKGFNEKGLKVYKSLENTILNEDIVSQLIGVLTEEQTEVADELQEYMQDTGGKWGNEVSEALYGIRKFDEPNYFPMTVSPHSVAGDVTKEKGENLFSILNYGFTKELQPGANHSLEISDIFDVFATHMNMTAIYNAYALPVYDMARWFRYRTKDTKGNEINVRTSIEKAFGKYANTYISHFISDLNAQHESSRVGFIEKIFRSAKVAMVGNSLSVVLLQPSAYIKAMVIISPKHLTKSLLYVKDFGARRGVERAKKYCGIALLKSQGYFEPGVSTSITKKMIHDESAYDKIIDWSLKGAEKADEITWGVLWNACEFEIREKRKDLKVGSPEYFEAVAEKLRDVIYMTQVVDSPLTKSDIVRSSDLGAKEQTMFMSEPTVAYNMAVESLYGYILDTRRYNKKEAWKRNSKNILKSFTAYTLTSLVGNGLIATLVQEFRNGFKDDEEDEETFAMKVLKNFLLDLNIFSKLPYFRDIISAFQGYDSTKTDALWYMSGIKAIEMWNKAKSYEEKAKDQTGDYRLKTLQSQAWAISQMWDNIFKFVSYPTGVAIYNQWRDLRGLLRTLGLIED